MFFFLIIFFIVNYLAVIGFFDLLRLGSDKLLHFFAVSTYIVIFIVFFSCPSIMEKWIVGVFCFEILGFILYVKGCLEYLKNKNNDLNQY
jgi:hypothetical protein